MCNPNPNSASCLDHPMSSRLDANLALVMPTAQVGAFDSKLWHPIGAVLQRLVRGQGFGAPSPPEGLAPGLEVSNGLGCRQRAEVGRSQWLCTAIHHLAATLNTAVH